MENPRRRVRAQPTPSGLFAGSPEVVPRTCPGSPGAIRAFCVTNRVRNRPLQGPVEAVWGSSRGLLSAPACGLAPRLPSQGPGGQDARRLNTPDPSSGYHRAPQAPQRGVLGLPSSEDSVGALVPAELPRRNTPLSLLLPLLQAAWEFLRLGGALRAGP